MSAILLTVALGGVLAGLHAQPAAYVWAGLALLGLAGHEYARRARRTGAHGAGGLRAYSVAFAAVLVAVTVGLWVLAATSGPDHRGAYTGLGILWTVMATAAVLLVVALERRRRARGRDGREHSNPS